jgi:hypothetical protein
VDTSLYSARIGESFCLGEEMSYDALLRNLIEFTVRGAVARSIDEGEWEHEELRRRGLAAIQIVRNGKAVWMDRDTFEAELAEARRELVEARFLAANELDPALCERLDRELRARWRLAGYETPSLLNDMKKLFLELQRDAADRAATARERLVGDVLHAQIR